MPRTIAVLGGTGPEGYGLTLRWARAGDAVVLGCASHPDELRDALGQGDIVPMSPGDAWHADQEENAAVDS